MARISPRAAQPSVAVLGFRPSRALTPVLAVRVVLREVSVLQAGCDWGKALVRRLFRQ